MKQQTQTLYKPKPQKIKPVPKPEPTEIVLQDVLHYFINKAWEQRAFILLAILIIENAWLLVR